MSQTVVAVIVPTGKDKNKSITTHPFLLSFIIRERKKIARCAIDWLLKRSSSSWITRFPPVSPWFSPDRTTLSADIGSSSFSTQLVLIDSWGVVCSGSFPSHHDDDRAITYRLLLRLLVYYIGTTGPSMMKNDSVWIFLFTTSGWS